MSVFPALELESTLRQLYQNPQHRHSSSESSYADRLASFTAWPHASPTPQKLARAGFSHRPTNKHPDNIVCRYGDYLYNWKPDYNPRIQRHIHYPSCSSLWLVLATADRKKPSTLDIRFFDPSLQYDFPKLCLFQNIRTFCNHIKQLNFFKTDIQDLLPRCLRGEALTWFRSQSKHRNLAVCIREMRSRFWQASQQAPQQALPEEAPQPMESACQAPDYHHCKLCNASFSSMARLIRHTQKNTCNKPCCRHCETVFSSKNQLHQHLREECQKYRQRGSSFKSSSKSSFRSSFKSSSPSLTACSSTCSLILSPAPSPASSPHPRYRAISPSPPNYLTVADLLARYARPAYLNVDDLFRMFGPRSAATKSSPNHQIRASSRITIASDDPFARPFVLSKKSKGSTQIWELGLATSYNQIAQAQCSAPRSVCERCRRSPLLDIDKRHAMPNLV